MNFYLFGEHFKIFPGCWSRSYFAVVRTAYWTLSNNQGAEAAEQLLSTIRGGFRITRRKGVVAALSFSTSLLTGRSSSRPLSSAPAFGLTLVETILQLASSLDFPCDDEEDCGLALTLQIVSALQVHPVTLYLEFLFLLTCPLAIKKAHQFSRWGTESFMSCRWMWWYCGYRTITAVKIYRNIGGRVFVNVSFHTWGILILKIVYLVCRVFKMWLCMHPA